MGKRARRRIDGDTGTAGGTATLDPAAPGPRQPCPCGSGKRYKACHGAPGAPDVYVARTFADLAGECDLVAMREVVPSATARVALRTDAVVAAMDEAGLTVPDGAPAVADRTVLVCTLLPMSTPAIVRPDGEVWLALQVQHDFGDISRDLAAVLLRALATEPGSEVGAVDPGAGPRLQDLLDPDVLEVTVHEGFDWWVPDADQDSSEVAAGLQAANDAAAPTVRLDTVEAAYWTRMNDRRYLRWVFPQAEDTVLDALARLHADGDDAIGPDTRLIGAFRAHGLLVPVWELDAEQEPADVADAVAALGERITASMETGGDLTAAQRSARNGLLNRQITIR